MVNIAAFLDTIFNTTYNATETEAALNNATAPLYPPFLYSIKPDRDELKKVFNSIPKWKL